MDLTVTFFFLSVGQIYLNNAFALDSAWVQPEESRLFQGAEKPLLLSNQVAMAVARPAAASRPLPTLLLAPQLIPGQEITASIIHSLTCLFLDGFPFMHPPERQSCSLKLSCLPFGCRSPAGAELHGQVQLPL